MTSLALNRLGEREAAAIIARLVGNEELPTDVMAEIVERGRTVDRIKTLPVLLIAHPQRSSAPDFGLPTP